MQNDPPDATQKAEELAKLIKKSKSGKKWRWIIGGVVLIAIAAAIYMAATAEPEARTWVSEPVMRGDLQLSATATGDLKPKRTVTIGAETSGQILSVEVEANDTVTKGQVLLRFDTEALDNQLLQANAALSSARANQRGAQATLEAATIDYDRTATLAEKKMASRSALDQKRAEKLRATASLEAGRASVARARAEVAAAKTQLGKATITSPIDGVVMTQNVEGGNTVASTLQTPELFVLAEDLSQMELHIEVDEADIGLVEPGQKATFNVDAWPKREFKAVVNTVSLSPTEEQSVVTYTVELSVDNSERLLRPGMTATATITTGVHKDVLLAPNAALRFTPPSEDGAEEGGGLSLRRKRPEKTTVKAAKSVWILRDNEPAEIPVDTGPSDGKFTEITPLKSANLNAGDAVILREKIVKKGAKESTEKEGPSGKKQEANKPEKRKNNPATSDKKDRDAQ